MHSVDPANANRILNDQSASAVMQRQSLAENYMHQYASQLEKNIVTQSGDINPQKNYQDAVNGMSKSSDIHSGFANNSQALQTQAASDGVEFSHSKMTSLESNVNSHQSAMQSTVKASDAQTSSAVRNTTKTSDQEIAQGKATDQKGITRHVF